MKRRRASGIRKRTQLAVAGFALWVAVFTLVIILRQGESSTMPTLAAKVQAAVSEPAPVNEMPSVTAWFASKFAESPPFKTLTPVDVDTLSPEDLMTRMFDWVRQAPLAALNFAAAYLQEPPYDEILGFALEEAGRLHFDDAYRWVSQQPQALQAAWLKSIFIGLSQHSPSTAANQAQMIEAPDVRKHILTHIVELWTENSPQEAALWLNTQGNTAEYHTARVAWLHHGGVENLSLSLDTLSRITDASERSAAATYIAEQWAARYPDTVGEWLELIRVADESSYSPALQAALVSLASQPDYQWTALRLATQPYQGAVQNDWVFGVIQKIAERAPQDIAYKLMELPAESRAFAAEFIAEKWLARDSIAAEAWVNSLTNTVESDYAKRAVFNHYALREPQHASMIKSSINDPFLRLALELPQYEN